MKPTVTVELTHTEARMILFAAESKERDAVTRGQGDSRLLRELQSAADKIRRRLPQP